jgi:hypothetical protein
VHLQLFTINEKNKQQTTNHHQSHGGLQTVARSRRNMRRGCGIASYPHQAKARSCFYSGTAYLNLSHVTSPVTSHQSHSKSEPITIHQSPVTIHQSPVTSHHSPITSHHSPVTNHQSPVTNHQSPITNHQSPVTNHQLPITSHQSPITRSQTGCYRVLFSRKPLTAFSMRCLIFEASDFTNVSPVMFSNSSIYLSETEVTSASDISGTLCPSFP